MIGVVVCGLLGDADDGCELGDVLGALLGADGGCGLGDVLGALSASISPQCMQHSSALSACSPQCQCMQPSVHAALSGACSCIIATVSPTAW